MDEHTKAEKVSKGEMAALLRTVADALETKEAHQVHVGDQSIMVPGDAEIEVEYKQEGDEQELAIELKWSKTGKRGGIPLPAKAGLGAAIAAAAIAGGYALLTYL